MYRRCKFHSNSRKSYYSSCNINERITDVISYTAPTEYWIISAAANRADRPEVLDDRTAISLAIGCLPLQTQKARPGRPRFLQQEKRRGEEKMKKGEIIYIIYNARSDIRATVCICLDLYGFIIAVNC